MKVYYGNGDNDYIEEHMTMEEINKLIHAKYFNQSIAVANEMKKPNCDN